MNYYQLTPNVAGEYRSIREQTDYPAAPHILGTKRDQINPNNTAKAGVNDFYIYIVDIVIDGIVKARKGDKWWKVYEANGRLASDWVAEIHLGKVYLFVELKEDTPIPPPPNKTVTSIMVDNPVKVTLIYSDGTQQTLP
jgi:hypothetical protein